MKILSYFAFANFILLLIYVVYGLEHIKKSKLATPYILMSLSLAWWCLGSTFFYVAKDIEMAVFWYEFSGLGWITFPAFTLHFFLLLGRFFDKDNKARNKRILFLMYLVPFVFLIKELIFKKHIMYTEIIGRSFGRGWTGVNTVDNIWSWMYVIYLIIYFVIGFHTIKKWGRMSAYNSERKHSYIILLASFITFVFGFSTDIISPFFDSFLPPVADLFLIIIIIETFFVMRKYRPFDDPGQIKSKTVLNSINDPVIFFDSEYKVAKINKAVTDILGYSFEELQTHELIDIVADHKYNEQNIRTLFANKNIRNKEINLLAADGRVLNTIYSATIVENEYNEFIGYIITFKDITDKKVIEKQIIESNEKYKQVLEELYYLANCDQLTGLLNRGSFYRKLKELVHYYNKYGYDFGIIFADLNGFKLVNDIHGHDIGDAVLLESARRLEKCMDDNGIVFRIGGDEFVIILQMIADDTIFDQKINEIRKMFSESMKVNGSKEEIALETGISLGHAVFSESEENLDIMIKKADTLMYKDKVNGKDIINVKEKNIP